MNAGQDRGAIGLGERLLTLLEDGGRTATYKYAVLLGLMDVCMERTTAKGLAPSVITTRQLAERVTDLYWPHASPYVTNGQSRILRQNNVGQTQAEIVSRIRSFRERYAALPDDRNARLKTVAPKPYETLVRFVEWKLIEMPLPRLQRVGMSDDPFLYQINWKQSVARSTVAAYQRGQASEFDNRILMRPSVGEHLISLHGLLRPIIHRRWAAMVAKINRLEDARLEAFLFGAERVSTEPVREFLREIQGGLCFFCRRAIQSKAEVDHFIPWMRYPDNGLDNLVLAHAKCNHDKLHYLAANCHVESWVARFQDSAVDAMLTEAAHTVSWERSREQTVGIARAIYLRLPEGAKLWKESSMFDDADQSALKQMLACIA